MSIQLLSTYMKHPGMEVYHQLRRSISCDAPALSVQLKCCYSAVIVRYCNTVTHPQYHYHTLVMPYLYLLITWYQLVSRGYAYLGHVTCTWCCLSCTWAMIQGVGP